MADSNQFSGRPAELRDIKVNDIIIRALRDEFPNDELFQQGMISTTNRPEPKPVTSIAQRSKVTKLLEIDADVSASYGEYELSKLLPGIEDNELDEILEDEFAYFVADFTVPGFPVPPTSGLFLIPVDIDNIPLDWHDRYVQSGPELITEMIASGMDDDDVIRNVFCVWYIERDQGRPIPNYKTLEYMLVERGLTYNDIGIATVEDIARYDLRLDGRYKDYALEDENGVSLTPPTLLDEFVDRSIVSKAGAWTYKTRFLSGYRPGKTTTAEQFLRDPGDYMRPEADRVPGFTETYSIGNELLTRTVTPREARIRRDDPEFDPAVQTAPWVDADPNDLYFDQVFYQTDVERLRAKYEGRLILPTWSSATTSTLFNLEIGNGSENITFDDLFFNLSFVMFGHAKQVISLSTLKKIARNLDINLLDYNSGLEDISGLIEDENIDLLDNEQYEALRDLLGIVNTMVRQGAVDVLGGETDPDWIFFPKVAEVNRLDITEYEQYVNEFAPNGMFNVEELSPYEPAGSLVYYNRRPQMKQTVQILSDQAAAQAILSQYKDAIIEKSIPLAAKAAEFRRRMNIIGNGGYVNKLQRLFGPDGDAQNILYETANVGNKSWQLKKELSKKGIDTKGVQDAFFKLVETEGQIIRDSMRTETSENEMFWLPSNRITWHVNTRGDDPKGAALILGYGPRVEDGVRLITQSEVEAMQRAGLGIDVETVGAQRYQRPESKRSGNRSDQQMKDPRYFRATMAQYIMEFIFDPNKFHPNYDNVPKAPEDFWPQFSGNAQPKDLVSICKEADRFIITVQSAVVEIEQVIANLDQTILDCDTIEEAIALDAIVKNCEAAIDSFDEDMFDYYDKLNRYIERRHRDLISGVVASIQFVRQRVQSRNKKYYIEWSESAKSRVNKWIGDPGFFDFRSENAY
jgi:hypothetical protein